MIKTKAKFVELKLPLEPNLTGEGKGANTGRGWYEKDRITSGTGDSPDKDNGGGFWFFYDCGAGMGFSGGAGEDDNTGWGTPNNLPNGPNDYEVFYRI